MAKITRGAKNSHQIFGVQLLSVAEFRARRKWGEVELNRAIQASTIFVIKQNEIDHIPDILAEEQLIRAGVEGVCKVLAPLGAGSKLQFFATPKASLTRRTPLQCLANGELAAVLVAAEGFVER